MYGNNLKREEISLFVRPLIQSGFEDYIGNKLFKFIIQMILFYISHSTAPVAQKAASAPEECSLINQVY